MVFISNHIKSNDTGQNANGRADEDVPWKVDAADDAHAGQRRAEDEQTNVSESNPKVVARMMDLLRQIQPK